MRERVRGSVGSVAQCTDLNMGMLRYLSAPRPVSTMPRKEIDSGDVCNTQRAGDIHTAAIHTNRSAMRLTTRLGSADNPLPCAPLVGSACYLLLLLTLTDVCHVMAG